MIRIATDENLRYILLFKTVPAVRYQSTERLYCYSVRVFVSVECIVPLEIFHSYGEVTIAG